MLLETGMNELNPSRARELRQELGGYLNFCFSTGMNKELNDVIREIIPYLAYLESCFQPREIGLQHMCPICEKREKIEGEDWCLVCKDEFYAFERENLEIAMDSGTIHGKGVYVLTDSGCLRRVPNQAVTIRNRAK